jgi:hypothetical protein
MGRGWLFGQGETSSFSGGQVVGPLGRFERGNGESSSGKWENLWGKKGRFAELGLKF